MGQRQIHVYEPLPKYVFHYVCPLSSFRTEGILSYPLNPVEFGYPTETLHIRNFFLFGLVKIQKNVLKKLQIKSLFTGAKQFLEKSICSISFSIWNAAAAAASCNRSHFK